MDRWHFEQQQYIRESQLKSIFKRWKEPN